MLKITKTAAWLIVAMLVVYGGNAGAQISGSSHDLSTLNGFNTGTEVCVFCHTPHAAASGEAPLWNKDTTPPTYQTYDSTTIDGTILAVGSVSLACLTCHDGTQARDAVVNAPGHADGLGFVQGAATVIGSMSSPTSPLDNILANLTTDLRDDHPIGVQYGGFDPGTGKIDVDFVDPVKHATLNRWWVDTSAGTAGTREKTDMILYTRDNGGSAQPFVECASCHDPHSGGNEAFLRIENTDSDVCLACHVK